jgi:hypothetical protein
LAKKDAPNNLIIVDNIEAFLANDIKDSGDGEKPGTNFSLTTFINNILLETRDESKTDKTANAVIVFLNRDDLFISPRLMKALESTFFKSCFQLGLSFHMADLG